MSFQSPLADSDTSDVISQEAVLEIRKHLFGTPTTAANGGIEEEGQYVEAQEEVEEAEEEAEEGGEYDHEHAGKMQTEDDGIDTAGAEKKAKKELLKVFLRVRPLSDDEKQSNEQNESIQFVGNTEVLMTAPKDSKTFKFTKSADVATRYTFTKTFQDTVDNRDFFQSTTLPMVKELIDGQNCLLFTYGVTNAGKTHTIQGVPTDPGILPRAIDVIFNSISDSMYTPGRLRPKHFCDVSFLSDSEQQTFAKAKEDCLNLSREMDEMTLSKLLDIPPHEEGEEEEGTTEQAEHRKQVEDDSADIEAIDALASSRIKDNTKIEVHDNMRYTVFVSYAEVYNEYIYDLLVRPAKGKRRTTCKLAENSSGDCFVKGLKEIEINSSDEAFKILRVGQRNRKVAATQSNTVSSRSHCIFTVKVVRVSNVKENNPHYATISRLSIVDLAGSERYSNTNTTGTRLKEAGNINTSLMTLGKCIEGIRWNQQHRKNNQRMVPFRESKLTRLFKNYLCGKGTARMIVNINPCLSTYDETQHVMKFSAVAKQVATGPIVSKIDTGLDRVSRTADTTDAEMIVELEAYNRTLTEMLETCQEQMADMEEKYAQMESEIREEVASEMAEQLVRIEQSYNNCLTQHAQTAEQTYEKKLKLYTHSVARNPARKRIREDDDEQRLEREKMLKEYEEENIKLTKALNATLTDTETQASQLVDAQEQLVAMQKSADQFETSRDADRCEITSLQLKLSKATSQNEKLEKTIAEMQLSKEAELSELQIQISVLEEEKKQTAIEAATATKSSKREQKLVQSATERLQDLTNQLEEQDKEFAGQLQEMATQNQRLMAQLEETTNQKAALEEKMEELTNSYHTTMASNTDLEDQVVQLKELLASTTSDFKELSATSIAKQEDLESQIADLTATSKKTKKADTVKKLEKQHSRIVSDFEARIRGQEDDVNTLQALVERLEGENHTLQRQLADLLEEQMESDLNKFVSTPAGAALSRTGSILSTAGVPYPAAAMEAAAEKAQVYQDDEENDQENDISESGVAIELEPAQEPEPEPAKKTKRGRKKSQPLKDQNKAEPKQGIKKKRKLFKKGDISSPLSKSESASDVEKKSSMFRSPIARRLRRRASKKAF